MNIPTEQKLVRQFSNYDINEIQVAAEKNGGSLKQVPMVLKERNRRFAKNHNPDGAKLKVN